MKFLLKCFFISTVLLFGVLVGIQISSNNIVQMTNDSRYSTTNVTESFRGIEAKFNSDEPIKEIDKLTSHDLKEKQEKLEKIESFNLFSQIGVQLSEALNKLFSSLLSKLTTSIGNVLT